MSSVRTFSPLPAWFIFQLHSHAPRLVALIWVRSASRSAVCDLWRAEKENRAMFNSTLCLPTQFGYRCRGGGGSRLSIHRTSICEWTDCEGKQIHNTPDETKTRNGEENAYEIILLAARPALPERRPLSRVSDVVGFSSWQLIALENTKQNQRFCSCLMQLENQVRLGSENANLTKYSSGSVHSASATWSSSSSSSSSSSLPT